MSKLIDDVTRKDASGQENRTRKNKTVTDPDHKSSAYRIREDIMKNIAEVLEWRERQ